MDANCRTCYPPLEETKVVEKVNEPTKNQSSNVEERFYLLNHKIDQMVAYTKEILDYVKSK